MPSYPNDPHKDLTTAERLLTNPTDIIGKINNTYLPEISLSKNIIAIKKFLGEYAKYVFVVVPSQHAFHIVKKYINAKLR